MTLGPCNLASATPGLEDLEEAGVNRSAMLDDQDVEGIGTNLVTLARQLLKQLADRAVLGHDKFHLRKRYLCRYRYTALKLTLTLLGSQLPTSPSEY